MATDTHVSRATRGSIAGAAGDGGVEYRRAVAAYAVAYGLAGYPLQGFGVPDSDAHVHAVRLETDDPVDDIRIDVTSGRTCYVQAKRELEKGVQFDSAIRQWVEAVERGLRPDRERLVICAGSISQSLDTLRRALDRYKTEQPSAFTKTQAKELDYLDTRLEGLSHAQRMMVRRCASMHKLEAEETHFLHGREPTLLLGQIVGPDNALEAWKALVAIAGKAASGPWRNWLVALPGGLNMQ